MSVEPTKDLVPKWTALSFSNATFARGTISQWCGGAASYTAENCFATLQEALTFADEEENTRQKKCFNHVNLRFVATKPTDFSTLTAGR